MQERKFVYAVSPIKSVVRGKIIIIAVLPLGLLAPSLVFGLSETDKIDRRHLDVPLERRLYSLRTNISRLAMIF